MCSGRFYALWTFLRALAFLRAFCSLCVLWTYYVLRTFLRALYGHSACSGRFDVPTLAWCVALALARGRSRWVGLVAPSQCHPVWTGSALAPGGARPDFTLRSTFTDLFPSMPCLRRFSYLSVTSSLSLSRLGTETRSTEVSSRSPVRKLRAAIRA